MIRCFAAGDWKILRSLTSGSEIEDWRFRGNVYQKVISAELLNHPIRLDQHVLRYSNANLFRGF